MSFFDTSFPRPLYATLHGRTGVFINLREASSDRDDREIRFGICRIGAVLATFGAEKGKETFGVVPKWVPIRCRLQPSGSA